jgi:hypothetical protein
VLANNLLRRPPPEISFAQEEGGIKPIPLLLVSVFPVLPTPKPLTGSKTAIPRGFWPALTSKALEITKSFLS